MDVIILGSGTAMPLNDRASPSIALIIQGKPVLFEMGPGALRQMVKAGIDFKRIKHIFLTHYHPDHTADLIHFLFATRNPSALKERTPFWLIGPHGLKRLIGDLQRAYAPWLTLPPGIMRMEELTPDQKAWKDWGGFKITWRPTGHTPGSIAYRVEETGGGRSVVYTGDTGFCGELVELARGANLLIAEAAFPEGKEVEDHLSPSQAGRIAALAKVDKLLLTHFYPECLSGDIGAQCRKTYDGELVVGRDLLHVRI